MADQPRLERRRTGWDIALGALSVIAGLIALAHVAIASVVSVLVLGWIAMLGGIVLAVGAIAAWEDHHRRWDLALGALVFLLGLSFVRNPGVGLLTLTLLAGALLSVGGVLRLVSAFQPGAPRGLSILSGVVTLVLGLMLFNQWPVSALWFLGTIVGVELILDGITTGISGRLLPVIDDPVRPTAAEPTPPVLA